MADKKQDIIYLEADEDITSAIDKLNKSAGSSVAVVAPKRSTLIQSLINLRLLKKAAADAGKFLVLVTGDRTATHLAGRLGIDVATTLGGQAAIPEIAGEAPKDEPEEITEDMGEPTPAEVAAMSAAVAAVKAAPVAAAIKRTAVSEADLPSAGKGIEVESEDDDFETDAADDNSANAPDDEPSFKSSRIAPDEPVAVDKPKRSLGHGITNRVPNFDSMQKRIAIGATAVGVLLILFVANLWLAHAVIRIYASGNATANSFTFTIDPAAKASDMTKNVIIGQQITTNRDATATLTATGQKDAGTKATGTMTIKNCEDSSPHNLPSGTQFKNGDKVFISDGAVTVPGGIFAGGGAVCNSGSGSVSVTALANGDGYNVAAGQYSSPAVSGNFKINGSQMAGGTTKNITVVTQADIDKAKADALAKDNDAAKTEIIAKVAAGYSALADSFSQTAGDVVANPALDAEATTGTVTVKAAYGLLAYNKNDLATIASQNLAKAISADMQVYDDGAGDAKVTKADAGSLTYHYTAQAYAGVKVDQAKVADSIKGKRYGDAVDTINKLPGVEKVEIDLSPGWNTSLPIFTQHMSITLKVADKN